MRGYTRSILAWIISALLVIAAAEGYNFGTVNGETNSSNYVPPDIPLKVIQANEILDKIKTGQPIEYDHVLIKGDLILSQLGLQTNSLERRKYSIIHGSGYDPGYNKNLTSFFSPISIRDSTVEGNVRLDNAIFINSISFINTKFNGTTDFRWSIFIDSAHFESCQFKGDAYFEGSLFNRSAVFMKSLFFGDTDFMESQFNEDANFVGSLFFGGANFPRSYFKGNAYFTNAYFDKDAYFYDSQFFKDAYFYPSLFRERFQFKVMFNKTVDFSRARFHGNAGFYGQFFDGSTDFSDSYFGQTADFRSCHFAKKTDFTNTYFLENTTFYASEFNDIIYFDGAEFSGSLNLTKTKFGHINIYWPHINYLICDDGPTYLALIKNYRDLEQYDAADDIYYRYRSWKQEQRTWSDRAKYFDILALYTCGYGVKVEYCQWRRKIVQLWRDKIDHLT